jgi:predicted nucleic acid-binding protein
MVAVLDASVLAKLFLQEKGTDRAEKVVTASRIILAPEIARIEVASAITRAFRNSAITVDFAKSKLNEWRRFLGLGNVRLIANEDLLNSAATFSLQLRHPLADCFYLALAAERNLALITADQPFVDAAQPHFPGIRNLFDSEH